MVELSIAVEGVFGLTWPAWKQLVRAVEDRGFAGLYLADHFVPPGPPDYPSLDLIVALVHAADHTDRVRFGSLVAPLSYRDPVMLARQAAALAELSGGRMVLGVGAGWMAREHEMFGYDLGDVSTRMNRLEEGLQVITRLLRTEEPIDFSGKFFQLRDAVLPGPRRPGGPPVLVGASGPKRGLPLVARYADVWNAQQLTPEQVRERSAMLDGLILEAGRHPGDVRRTFNWRPSGSGSCRSSAHRRRLSPISAPMREPGLRRCPCSGSGWMTSRGWRCWPGRCCRGWHRGPPNRSPRVAIGPR
jgi:alkanesulfonate monooxygenase SsuD/methylene tetrahydromethanopterin reductase-like flavin-dependent oxidoreductase (luciferase family)